MRLVETLNAGNSETGLHRGLKIRAFWSSWARNGDKLHLKDFQYVESCAHRPMPWYTNLIAANVHWYIT